MNQINQTRMCRGPCLLAMLCVLSWMDAPCTGQGLSVNIVGDGTHAADETLMAPRFDRLSTSAPGADDGENEAEADRAHDVQAATERFGVEISPTGGTNCPSLGDLSAGSFAQAIANLGVSCKACAERSDFLEAAHKYLSSLSIRSLKNVLAVRSARCKTCRSRKDLEMASLHAAALPPKTVTLAVWGARSAVGPGDTVRCFPRGVVYLSVVEARHQMLVQIAMQSTQRFALTQPGHDIGIVARILQQGVTDGNAWIKVQCEQRIHMLGPAEEPEWTRPITINAGGAVPPHAQGLRFSRCRMFVDDPVFRHQVAELDGLQRSVRRLFFRIDGDVFAEARVRACQNHPPEEAHGPESLSHWISQAIFTPNMTALSPVNMNQYYKNMARIEAAGANKGDLELGNFLLRTVNTTRRLDVLHDYLASAVERLRAKR